MGRGTAERAPPRAEHGAGEHDRGPTLDGREQADRMVAAQ